MKKKVIIIGSGLGGLAAACRIAASGYEVEIFEKRNIPGGSNSIFEINGFKFDGVPSTITAPYLLDELFSSCGKKRADHFSLLPVDPYYRIFHSEGKSFDYTSNPDQMALEIEKWSPRDIAGYRHLLESNMRIYKKWHALFSEKPSLNLMDFLSIFPALISLQNQKNMVAYVSQFIHHEFLREVFSFHPLLIGSNPFEVSALSVMSQHVEKEFGVFYPQGGFGKMIDTMIQMLEEAGGAIHYGHEVTEIILEQHKVEGVRLKDGSIHRADVVISDIDTAHTYMNLIPESKRRKNSDQKYQKAQYSMSLFGIFIGTKCRYLDSRLAHKNCFFGPRYKGLMDDIFQKKILADDFFLIVNMPTRTDPSIAPEGCELFSIYTPVPNLDAEINWKISAQSYRDAILEFLEKNYLPDLRSNIIAENYIDPLYFQNELNKFKGSAFSLLPTLIQSPWFRPRNQSEDFENLFIVGAGTHPGAGLADVLTSAKIVGNLVQQYLE